ncbi:unnamed protein product [Allacma fusca]|uniref:Protein root UVB sensitive/RUS domain-containing protein n=1 Tax=Allacma fusca TaxID=39272 RepID=A0A8J2KEU4_9HEXA|nr:unnamed protein product [Allacma fusca]
MKDPNKQDAVLISENRGLYSSNWNYIIRKPGAGSDSREIIDRVADEGTRNNEFTNWFNKLRLTIRQVFLPYGYPASVSSDYLNYQIYDTIQAFCSSLTGALATEAVMKGVGVGDEAATPLAAAVTWLLKSGSGMIGQIVFTWAQGTSLDCDCKKWRFFADMVNDTAIFIDLLTPALNPDIRVAVFCLSSVARSLVGVAGGATRAAITQHQARQNNTADVSAKDGSQETLVNLVALIASLLLLPNVSGNTGLIWTLYLLFTALHLLANFKALKSLQLESLNTSRLLHCLSQFVKNETVPSIADVNNRESLFIGVGIHDAAVTQSQYQIKPGVPFAVATGLDSDHQGNSCLLESVEKLISSSDGKRFLIIPRPDKKIIYVVLDETIPPWELIEGYSRAFFLSYQLSTNNTSGMSSACTNQWLRFESALTSAGYSKRMALLKTEDWRATWRKQL